MDYQFKNNIFAIMHKYMDEGCQLKQILGTIFLSYPFHYVHIIIDLEKKIIITKELMGINKSMQNSVSKICMFVAKDIGVEYKFVMDDKKEEEVYFGQSYMKEKFVEK